MRDNIKILIYMVIFCIFMILSIVLYNNLSSKENIIEEDINSETQTRKKLKSFELSLEDDSKIDINSYVGTPMVINVWTSWCTYCHVEMSSFNEMYKKEKDNVKFIMINATGDRDTKEAAQRFINENNYEFDVYYDLNLEAITALGIYSYPTTIFVDKEGYIDTIKTGVITQEELEEKINELK